MSPVRRDGRPKYPPFAPMLRRLRRSIPPLPARKLAGCGSLSGLA